MRLKYFTATRASISHPEENQDSFFVDTRNHVAGVFDGVGGLSYGKEAAVSAAEFCKVEINQVGIEKTLTLGHEFLKEKAKKEFGKNIATTAIIAQIYPGQNPAFVVWGSVGDSRTYHFSEKLNQISQDDSLISQAMENDWISAKKADQINQATDLKDFNKVEKNLFFGRNMITQALGIGVMKPNIGKFKAKKGDAIILTSDGVHDNLTNKQMEEILNQVQKDPAHALVKEAQRVSESDFLRAKPDDMCAVVIELI